MELDFGVFKSKIWLQENWHPWATYRRHLTTYAMRLAATIAHRISCSDACVTLTCAISRCRSRSEYRL